MRASSEDARDAPRRRKERKEENDVPVSVFGGRDETGVQRVSNLVFVAVQDVSRRVPGFASTDGALFQGDAENGRELGQNLGDDQSTV